MAEFPLKKLLVQVSHYSLASLFVMVAGLVTFPILTRIFSVADYGVMNLVAATLTVSVALGKVGIQHSILRYHSEISTGKRPITLGQLYSTTLFGMIVTATGVTLIVVVATRLLPTQWLGGPHVRRLFAIASTLIIVQVVESALVNFLRAEQRTATLMKYQVVKKYLGLALILTAVLLISGSLVAFYTATVVAETLAVCALAVLLFGFGTRQRPTLSQFSRPLYRELLAFGIPMMVGYELSGIVLAVGDRYVIEGMLGETPLGLYSAAYNLCQYVQAVFILSVGQAVLPIYMQMWEQKGLEETRAFIGRSLRTYVLLGTPIVAGLAAVGPDLLPLLASEKYAGGAQILPWVVAGMVVDGSNTMLGAGLFIHRKTRIVMACVLSCAAANIGLNLILVPRIGILGSAVATLVSYTATASAMAIAGRHLIKITVPWGTLLRATLVALVMYAALHFITPGSRIVTVLVRIVTGGAIYVAMMALMDPDARSLVRKGLARLQRRRAKVGDS